MLQTIISDIKSKTLRISKLQFAINFILTEAPDNPHLLDKMYNELDEKSHKLKMAIWAFEVHLEKKYWTTSDGKSIRYPDLAMKHIDNILRYFTKTGINAHSRNNLYNDIQALRDYYKLIDKHPYT